MNQKTIRKMILLSGCTALSIHLANKLTFYTATLKNLLDDSKGEIYNWRFGKIFYNRYGSGSPLLLLHDLHPASSGSEWRKLIGQLSKSHTVYVLDLFGCGRSEKTNITYTNFLYVQLISDFVKDVIKHKTNVIATGMSCSFTLMACFHNPIYFNKLIILNPLALRQLNKAPSKRTKTLKLMINSPVIGTLIYNILAAKHMIKQCFQEQYYYDPDKLEQQDLDIYYEAAHQKGAVSKFLFSSLKSNYLNLNIIHALKEINHSIYFIGGSDYSDIYNTAEEYCSYNPAIETEFIKECKYLPQLEKPEELLELLSIYLEKEEQSSKP